MKTKRVRIFILMWSFCSIMVQGVVFVYARELMAYCTSFFLDSIVVYPMLLKLFKAVLLLVIGINGLSIFLSKSEIGQVKFLWYIGITYASLVLTGLLVAIVILNMLMSVIG